MVEVSRSKPMRQLLAEGVRKTRRKRPPSDGGMISLVYRTLPNGWHYQVEWIHDTRFRPEPWVQVYAFRPPRDFSARSADLTLAQEDL